MVDRETNPLFNLEEDRPSTRWRETFFASIILHLLVVLLVVTHPEFFEASRDSLTNPEAFRQKDVTLLYEPPKLPRIPKLKTPPQPRVSPEAISRTEKRIVEPPSPPPARPAPAPAPVKLSEPAQQNDNDKLTKMAPQPVIPKPAELTKEQPKQRPTLEQVGKGEQQTAPSLSQSAIPSIAQQGLGTDAILRSLAQDNATGKTTRSIPTPLQDSGSNEMSMNIPGPQILSDTMGVDFNPYLLRILTIVRSNWSTVLPEIARMGRPGRVVVQFSIQKNGHVPDLALTGGSGTVSLDNAALSSVRLSSPFPPLPPEFPGQEVKLRFLFLYNMKGE